MRGICCKQALNENVKAVSDFFGKRRMKLHCAQLNRFLITKRVNI